MGGVCTLAGSIRAGLLDENKIGKKPWTDKKKKKKEARRPGRVRVKKGVYAKLG